MTKAELIDYAESVGVNGVDSAMKKADIISAIEAAQ